MNEKIVFNENDGDGDDEEENCEKIKILRILRDLNAF